MIIQLNGEAKEFEGGTLEDALNVFGYGDLKVATALNGDFVAAGLRPTVELSDGDRLEVLAPMQGG